MIRSYKGNVVAAAQKHGAEKVSEFCEVMADTARDLTPYDTGHNRDSINHEVSGMTGKVYTESGYGGWLEIGTSKMAAQPYFRPAYESARRVLSG